MTTKKTTEQIHAMYEMNNYGEPDISNEKWLLACDVQKEIEEHKKWNREHKCHKKKCCGDCYYNGFGDALLSLSTSLGLLEEEKGDV